MIYNNSKIQHNNYKIKTKSIFHILTALFNRKIHFNNKIKIKKLSKYKKIMQKP